MSNKLKTFRLPELQHSMEVIQGIRKALLKDLQFDGINAAIRAQVRLNEQLVANFPTELLKRAQDFQANLHALNFTFEGTQAQHEETLRKYREIIEPVILSFGHLGRYGPTAEPLPIEAPDPERLVLDVTEVNERLLKAMHEDPSILHQITPRTFEKVIAEVLKRKGYEVDLTPQSRDGGIDIFALKRDDIGKMLFLVQCKKYRPDNKVGVETVRELHGVLTSQRANAGVIITTSSFTKGAKNYVACQNLELQLQLKDFVQLSIWVQSLGLGQK